MDDAISARCRKVPTARPVRARHRVKVGKAGSHMCVGRLSAGPGQPGLGISLLAGETWSHPDVGKEGPSSVSEATRSIWRFEFKEVTGKGLILAGRCASGGVALEVE